MALVHHFCRFLVSGHLQEQACRENLQKYAEFCSFFAGVLPGSGPKQQILPEIRESGLQVITQAANLLIRMN